VILADNEFAGIVGAEWEWFPLQIVHSVPRHLLEIQTTPSHGYSALVSALESILVVTNPRVAEMIKTFIDEMTHGTDFKLINLLYAENAYLTHKDLNTSSDEPKNGWTIHCVSFDTLTSTVIHQATANTPTLLRALGLLITLIGIRLRIVWASKLR
jgi:hypothetical protein